MKTYILAAGLLIAGILAVATTISVVFPTQPSLNTTTTSSPQEQSAFITATTSLGDATITEVLVNTAVQFPIADRPSPSPQLNSDQITLLIVVLYSSAIVIGLSLPEKT